MTTILLCILAAPLLALAVLWAWSHAWIDGNPRSVPEAAVRVLLLAVRFLDAVAKGLQYTIITIRDEPIVSLVEDHRKAYEAAHPKAVPEPEPEPTKAVSKSPYWWWMKRKDDA
jgi:hypothetical protein